MGGVSTSVTNNLKQNTVKVGEGRDNDEYLITRLDHCDPPLNIINMYGNQECRARKDDILEGWARLIKDVREIECRGEFCLLMGDLNRKIGNDDLGIKGNDDKISFGGQLVRQLLEGGEYVQLNNLDIVVGGPYTWQDPADGSRKTCLDLVIGSAGLVPYVSKIEIDSERKFTPKRVVIKNGEIREVFTDHFLLVVDLEGLPMKRGEKEDRKMWNLHKDGGWKKYEQVTNDLAAAMEEAIEIKNINIEEVIKKVDSLGEKAKHIAFGKTKIKTKSGYEKRKVRQGVDTGDEANELLRKQTKKIEDEINDIKEKHEGRCHKFLK